MNLSRTFAASALVSFLPFNGIADIPGMDAVPLEALPHSFVVLMADDVTASDVLTEHGVSDADTFTTAIRGFAAQLSEAQVADLKGDPRVKAVEPNYVMHAYAQKNPTGVQRVGGLSSVTALINGKDERVDADVAVIDTGVQGNHPDLNVVSQQNFTTESDRNDRNGHGTHVAGTIGAKDNGVGAVGIAPGARIWSVKVLDRNGAGYLSDIIRGLDYVTAHASDIDIANMSLGCECQSAALDQAISKAVAAGVVVVVAAGNSGKDAATFSPANHPDVIAVSAIADFDGKSGAKGRPTCMIEKDDTFAYFSNYGAAVDVAAPGVCIYSTWKSSSYKSISGTSMASPHVAGAAALYIAKNGKPTSREAVEAVKTVLTKPKASLEDVPSQFTGDPDTFREVLLNVAAL